MKAVLKSLLTAAALGCLVAVAGRNLLDYRAQAIARELAQAERPLDAPSAPPAGAVLVVRVGDGYGTCWVADCRPVLEGQPGYLLTLVTASHVVRGFQTAELFDTGGPIGSARVELVSEDADVAILVAVLQEARTALEMAETDAKLGQRVTAWGYPETGPDNLFARDGRAANSEWHTAVLGPGSSGGPVVDYFSGEVVAINSRLLMTREAAISVPVSVVRSLLLRVLR